MTTQTQYDKLLLPSSVNAWLLSKAIHQGQLDTLSALLWCFELTLLIGFSWWTNRREQKAETARSGQCLTSSLQMSADSERLLGGLRLNSLNVILSHILIPFSFSSLHEFLTLSLVWSAVICIMTWPSINKNAIGLKFVCQRSILGIV